MDKFITLHIDKSPISVATAHIVTVEKEEGYTEIGTTSGTVLGVDETYSRVMTLLKD